jgi:HAT1-interacting factor 1
VPRTTTTSHAGSARSPSSTGTTPATNSRKQSSRRESHDPTASGALACWCRELILRTRSTAKYGDLAPENVEPLILYGKALLGSAIAQSAVLGGAAPGADEAAAAGGATNASFASAGDAAVGGSSSSAAAAAATAGSTTAGPSKPNFHFGGDADDDNDNDDGEEAGAGDDGGANDDDDDEENGAATGGDREDDLESAFQVLDMARATLEKEINADGEGKQEEETGADKLKEKKERLAEVHRLLGDVATESGASHNRMASCEQT